MLAETGQEFLLLTRSCKVQTSALIYAMPYFEERYKVSQVLDWKTFRPIFQLDPVMAAKRWSLLTPRESEVAERMAHGWTNQQIAESLQISPKTLDIHRSKVKAKLEAKTSAGVATVFFVMQLAKVISPQP